jgi:AmmeMemoRadiSam system protein B
MGGRMSSNTSSMSYIGKAYHAGLWYSYDKKTLDQELAGYLSDVVMNSSTIEKGLRGIVCPHAGYSYSRPTDAYSYSALCQELSKKESPIRTILVLHPSHHLYLERCAVSCAHILETPMGKLTVNETLRQEILALGNFTYMEQGEMQYPYIAKVRKDTQKTDSILVLPIMCGNLSTTKEAFYGKLLAPIMVRPEVLCVISTDFCHWGTRFHYQPTSQENTMPIHEFIQQLDQQGMQHISNQEPGAFA